MATTKKKKRTTSKKKPSIKKSTKRKATKKRSTKKRTVRRTTKTTPVTINMPAPQQQAPQNTGMNKLMLENFVALQRILTNLSTKMEGLTTQLTKLLDLFEISAKSLADREFEIEKDNKETLEKLNVLLDQNKVLARGLSLMHERIPHDQFPHPPTPGQQNINVPGIPSPGVMPMLPQSVPKSPLTRELAPSPPPFQQPPMSFPSPAELSSPRSLKPLQTQKGTPSIMSPPPQKIPNDLPIPTAIEPEYEDISDTPPLNPNDDLSDIPNPEDLELESPPR